MYTSAVWCNVCGQQHAVVCRFLSMSHGNNIKDNFSTLTLTNTHTLTLHMCTVDCYNTSDLGQSYTGRRAFTQSGELCDSWGATHLLFNASLYSELTGAENFCRNPGRLREKPWCFTSKNSWNYCNLPTNCTGEFADCKYSMLCNNSTSMLAVCT